MKTLHKLVVASAAALSMASGFSQVQPYQLTVTSTIKFPAGESYVKVGDKSCGCNLSISKASNSSILTLSPGRKFKVKGDPVREDARSRAERTVDLLEIDKPATSTTDATFTLSCNSLLRAPTHDGKNTKSLPCTLAEMKEALRPEFRFDNPNPSGPIPEQEAGGKSEPGEFEAHGV